MFDGATVQRILSFNSNETEREKTKVKDKVGLIVCIGNTFSKGTNRWKEKHLGSEFM